MEQLKLTKRDLKELDEELKRNFEQRLRFIDAYVEWLKKMQKNARAEHVKTKPPESNFTRLFHRPSKCI